MSTTPSSHDIADPALAAEGAARIAWADGQMPVLASIRERFAAARPLAGLTVAASLHVTAETANLVRTLLAGGAQVALCAANPLSTQDDAAAALVERFGAEVHAVHGESTETYYRHIAAVADRAPQITIDDGADVLSMLHGERTDLVAGMIGGVEATSSGAIRCRVLQAEGRLRFPVVAADDARTKSLFDNRLGTGQSTLDGIVRATNVLLAGRTVVVFGFGACGRGVADRARGAGASVIVCEIDPVRALEARCAGHEVMPGLEAAERGDVFITVTGNRDVIVHEHLERMRDGAILANAGHFDVEISVADLAELAVERRTVRPGVDQHVLADGRRLHLLAAGRVVNLAAAEGHPASVMDISFATQALAVEHLVQHGNGLERAVHPVPASIDEEVASLKLAAMGVRIDRLSDGQKRYLGSWELGT